MKYFIRMDCPATMVTAPQHTKIIINSYKLFILMTTAFSLPKIMEMEISALVRSGYYSSKSDVAKDAFRTLFSVKKQLKIASAVEMYKSGEVSLTRAAEISEIDVESFKAILLDRKITIQIVVDNDVDSRARDLLEEAK